MRSDGTMQGSYVEFSFIKKLHARITEVSPANPGETLNDAVERLIAERDALRETNEVLAGKLDDMIIVNGQALACSSYVRAEVDALREDNKRLRALLTELTYTPDNASHNAP